MASAQIAIDETNFPDENFRYYLLEQSYGKDGVITDEEIKRITQIYVSNKSISSLKGIEYFTSLAELHCYNNQLTSLDVSGCTKLNDVSRYNNQIKGITMDALINSLPRNTSYKYISIYFDGYEDNICTHSQVAAIKAKGWIIGYEGCDEPTPDVVSVGTDGLATYCPAFDMDFTNAKEIVAYKANVSGNEVLLKRVYSVAAGEGVLLRSLNGGEATEDVAIKATEKSEGNAFVGVLEAKTLKEKDGNVTNFVLSNVNGEVGFFKANDTRISAWKAYLPVEDDTADMAAKGLCLVFDDATGISDVTAQPSAEDDAIYTLSGVRVANPTKGIYIKNGKKMVVK